MTGLNRLEKVGALLGSQNVRMKYFKGKKKKSPVKWLKFRGNEATESLVLRKPSFS